MKILLVIEFFTPMRGGSVNVVYNLSKELAKNGHDITIITTDFEFDEKFVKSIEEEGVNVVSFHCVVNIGLFLFSPSIKKWLKKNIKNFDIIHIHNFRSYQNIIVCKYAKIYGIPYILQAHGSSTRIVEKKMLKQLFDWAWGYKILRDAHKLLAVSQVEVEQYKHMKINEDKIIVIPNGIDINVFKKLPNYGQFKKKYCINEEYMFIFLGRIHKRKGIDFLIRSFSKLIKERKDIVLLIIGPPSRYSKKVENLIKSLNLTNKIKIIGYVDEKDKLSSYVDADALIYPAIFEIFGLVPFEAIMCGTPVIVTDDCGCGQLVRDANCGYIVKYGNVDSLKEKMKLIIQNPEEGKMMSKRGENYIKENLTWNNVVRKIEKIYEDCNRKTGSI